MHFRHVYISNSCGMGLMMKRKLIDFVTESNAIEGINCWTHGQLIEAKRFIDLKEVTIADLEQFVEINAPGHKLRLNGECVTVGNHVPPRGGAHIGFALQDILDNVNSYKFNKVDSFYTHIDYEKLHAFTDGNGRSGRILWLWQENKRLGRLPSLSFLHSFYYQSLSNSR